MFKPLILTCLFCNRMNQFIFSFGNYCVVSERFNVFIQISVPPQIKTSFFSQIYMSAQLQVSAFQHVLGKKTALDSLGF